MADDIPGPEAFALEFWRLFSAMRRVTRAGGVIHLFTSHKWAKSRFSSGRFVELLSLSTLDKRFDSN